jgi:hypothetical protein
VTFPADPPALKARLQELALDLPFEVTVRPMMGGYIGYAEADRSECHRHCRSVLQTVHGK